MIPQHMHRFLLPTYAHPYIPIYYLICSRPIGTCLTQLSIYSMHTSPILWLLIYIRLHIWIFEQSLPCFYIYHMLSWDSLSSYFVAWSDFFTVGISFPLFFLLIPNPCLCSYLSACMNIHPFPTLFLHMHACDFCKFKSIYLA